MDFLLIDEEQRTISRIEKFIFLFVFFHMILGVIFSYINLEYYNSSYVREDALIEWLTFDALILSGVISWWRAFKLRSYRNFLFLLVLFCMGFVFFFGAGEEISWGQRIFNIQSSKYFLENNSQGEMNFHNLVIGGVRINKLFFGLILSICVIFYLLIVPFIYRKFLKFAKFVDHLGIPIPRYFHIACYVLVAILVQLTVSPKRGELLEFGGCWIFFLMILNPYNSRIYHR